MTDLAVKLLIAGAILVAAAIGVKSWISKHDKARDTQLTAEANVRTEKAAENIGEAGEEAEAETAEAEAIVDAGESTFERKYEERRRASPEFRNAADAPVPDELRKFACERQQERERFDRNERSPEEDGGTTLSKARSWFGMDERPSDVGERIPSGC